MASKSVLELAVGTGQWDSGLKKAKQALDNFTQANGGLQSALNKDSQSMQQFVKMMGQMDSTAKTAKGQMNDYKGTIEQLTMQYNRMTDAQKKTIGQDYLHAIDQMKQKYQGVAEEVQKINQSLKSMPEPAAQSGGGLFGGGKMSGMLQVFGGNVMTKLAGAGMGFVTEMGDMVKQGIELARAGEGIRIAFERLGRGDILDGLRKATHGTVTDLELMKAAVKFNDFKLPLDELGTMLAFAQQKAKDTGQSVDYMVDSIVTGLGRKSLMILDNLGLSATEIRERMKETGDMTKAVGAIIRDEMAKAGDYVETAADRAAQANVSLQNKMEELGRKFAPIEEASNQLWTSMKIGILEVVGGPLSKILNSLTEAGRLMNALSDNNGEQGSGNTKVDQQLNKLRGSNYKQFYYNKVVGNYTKQINDLQAQINNGGKKPGAGSGTSQDVRYLTAQKQSLEVMRGLFRSGAKDIMQPVKVDIKTDEAEQNVASLTKKLKELQEQRKKAIASGDKQKSADLLKQINQTKNDIKGLGGGTTTTTTHQTPQQRAQESFTKAEQNYKQALEQAAMELQAGTITRAQAAQKEAQAAEQRWKAIGDARNISDSDRLRQAQDEAAAEYKRLAAEAKTATERQKAVDKATRDLENANQKLATARSEMAQARQHGDLQAYNTAKDKATAAQKEITRLTQKVDVVPGTVTMPDVPSSVEVPINYTESNLGAFISHLKEQLSQAELGSELYNNLTAQLADANTLGNLMETAIKNGIDTAQFDPQALWRKIFGDTPGDYISNEEWKSHVSTLNQQIRDNENKDGQNKNRTRFKFERNTGEIKKEDNKETQVDILKGVETMTGSLQGIFDGITKLGIELPQELTNIFGVVQTIASIVSAIQTMETVGKFLGIIPGFAHGGVVHAANGYVDGNTYSGDQIPAMLNAGEVVLNRSQAGVLAASLQAVGQSGEGGGDGKPYVSGEMIWLGLTNYLNRSGRGEIVTSKRR